MQQIRVIVVDDSAFMRKVITDILESDSRIKVIATARNGEDGLKKINELQPDVVTMDIHMPVMDGMSALRVLMETNPIPVVMLSSVSEEQKSKTIDAISNGAVDFITKPSGPISLDIELIKDKIISKVITASQINLNRKKSNTMKEKFPYAFRGNTYKQSIIAIGTSTGGPKALQQIFLELPKDFKIPIVIVQHMPEGFTKSLANRLNSLGTMTVKEAEDGDILKPGSAYIAPGNYHMMVDKEGSVMKLKLSQDEPRKGHRPSVDVLFESIANINHVNKIAVILTGMGNDGTEGLIKMKETMKDTIVIAESEETAIVYGMPKTAVQTGFVDYILPLYEISEQLVSIVKGLNKN